MSISFENYEKCVQALKSSINGSPKAIDALIKETQARGFSPDHIRTSIGRLGSKALENINKMLRAVQPTSGK